MASLNDEREEIGEDAAATEIEVRDSGCDTAGVISILLSSPLMVCELLESTIRQTLDTHDPTLL